MHCLITEDTISKKKKKKTVLKILSKMHIKSCLPWEKKLILKRFHKNFKVLLKACHTIMNN